MYKRWKPVQANVEKSWFLRQAITVESLVFVVFKFNRRFIELNSKSVSVVSKQCWVHPNLCFVVNLKTFEEVEQYMLGGQKLQGPHTVYEVYHLLKENDLLDE